MPRLLMDIECNKKTCGKCEHKKQLDMCPINYKCRIFNKNLKVKTNKPTNKPNFLSFYRLKECLQAEKDYVELLMEGW